MKLGKILTQSKVSAFLAQFDGTRKALSDGQVRGLQLERLGDSKGKWRLRFRDPKGRRSCLTIGDAPTLSLAEARSLAEDLRRQVSMGINPLEEKAAQGNVPTFAEFVESQYLPFAKSYKRSWATDMSLLKNHLLPRFAKRHMDEISGQDIVKMLSDRKATGAAVGSNNRLLIMMRYIFNLALKWKVPGVKENPTKNVPLLPESSRRERYLSAEEAKRLYVSVCRSENPMLKFIVPTLILTGCRRGEVLHACWSDFDFERRLWRIPTTKLGRPRYVPLSDGVMSLLSAIPRDTNSEYVFANPITNKPFVSIFAAWDTARQRAGLADVRIHDLRHSFASLLINSGRSLYEVQKLLGHTQIKTTQRYAHLSPETLLAASNAATQAVGSVMGVMPNHVVDVPLIQAQGA